jgi:hypothetical protein
MTRRDAAVMPRRDNRIAYTIRRNTYMRLHMLPRRGFWKRRSQTGWKRLLERAA